MHALLMTRQAQRIQRRTAMSARARPIWEEMNHIIDDHSKQTDSIPALDTTQQGDRQGTIEHYQLLGRKMETTMETTRTVRMSATTTVDLRICRPTDIRPMVHSIQNQMKK